MINRKTSFTGKQAWTSRSRMKSVANMEELSAHDQAVIRTIFDPVQTSALDDSAGNENRDTKREEKEDESLSPEVLVLIRKAISCAEMNDFKGCFQFFEEALKIKPNSPSILNDRAQALRLAGKDEEALEDLHSAVKFSNGKGKAGTQALCQRGILYRSMNMDHKAKEDFRRAAKGGSEFAVGQLVELDPYAAMSNAVLEEFVGK